MADTHSLDWNFINLTTPILSWVIVGMVLYIVSIFLLFVVFNKSRANKSRQSCSLCNVILFTVLFVSICINILALLFMGANNGVLPMDYARFAFKSETHLYTTDEQMYFILYALSFNTLNIYCLIIILMATIRELDSIASLKHSFTIRLYGACMIIVDVSYRVICILLYCTSMANTQAIWISLYCVVLFIYFGFVALIFVVTRNAAQANDVFSVNYQNGLSHLRILHFVFIVWFISTVSCDLIAAFCPAVSVLYHISLWIQLVLSVVVHLVVLYYLSPSETGTSIIDKSKNRHRTGSFSAADKRKSSYNKAGFVRNDKQKNKQSWFDQTENIHGTPESSVHKSDHEQEDDDDEQTTPKFMTEGVYDVSPKEKTQNTSHNDMTNDIQLTVEDAAAKQRKVTGDLL
eukprot:938344_1